MDDNKKATLADIKSKDEYCHDVIRGQKALAIVIKKLEVVIRSQKKTAEAERQKIDSLAATSADELAELYGYGDISRSEYEQLQDRLEDAHPERETDNERALRILKKLRLECVQELEASRQMHEDFLKRSGY